MVPFAPLALPVAPWASLAANTVQGFMVTNGTNGNQWHQWQIHQWYHWQNTVSVTDYTEEKTRIFHDIYEHSHAVGRSYNAHFKGIIMNILSCCLRMFFNLCEP